MVRGGPHILVADDEPHVVHILTRALAAQGYRVTGCADGREALDAARRDPPDLIITDARMPEMTGAELIAALGRCDATAAIPVVILSGRGHTIDPEALKAPSVRQVCSKPFSARAITGLVSTIIAAETHSPAGHDFTLGAGEAA